MTKVFLDTNVFLDLLLNRQNFAKAAETIMLWCNSDRIEGYTSAISISNIYYFVSKESDKVTAVAAVRKLLKYIHVPPTLKKDLLLSLQSIFTDFEDAVQYYSALNIDNVDFIITRNKKDFKPSVIPVVTSEEFVATFS